MIAGILAATVLSSSLSVGAFASTTVDTLLSATTTTS